MPRYGHVRQPKIYARIQLAADVIVLPDLTVDLLQGRWPSFFTALCRYGNTLSSSAPRVARCLEETSKIYNETVTWFMIFILNRHKLYRNFSTSPTPNRKYKLRCVESQQHCHCGPDRGIVGERVGRYYSHYSCAAERVAPAVGSGGDASKVPPTVA